MIRRSGQAFYMFVFLVALTACRPVSGQALELGGKWATRMGVIRVSQEGKKVSGKLIWVSTTCRFKKGDLILKGVMLEDSLSGKWRYCLKGQECGGSDWAPMLMLAARAGRVLSGAAHYKTTQCTIGGKGKGDGLVMRKLRPRPPKSLVEKADTGTAVEEKATALVDENGRQLEEEVKPLDPKDFEKNAGDWNVVMKQGAAQMDAGFFERARKYFYQATEKNPTRPEAFNGIGVTYYARGDYEEALSYYKKALEVDPNFGDAYYNMACIYSLLKKKSLAFRYLHIAALNGYAEHEAMEQDSDLTNLRSDKRYREILDKMKAK
ncbi:MAG TPA: tetratricopeptide repeat protein [Myxococcota bacterium]|nr:tetratricopeptide repeat protein [Myxococcota bacterium]